MAGGRRQVRFDLSSGSRLLFAWLMMLAATCSMLGAGSDVAQRKQFDLPRSDAEKALRDFSTQSGVQVLFSTNAASGVRTNEVKGEYTPREALTRLLQGTALSFSERNGTWMIARKPPEAAPAPARNVPGAAPAPTAGRPGTIEQSQGARNEVVHLSPFTVTTDSDVGYVATNALAGGRTQTPLRLTPSAVSAMTTEFIDDLAIGDMSEALQWTLNAESQNPDINEAGQGSHLVNFRGAGGAGNYPSRNYFIFYGIGDSYNTERFEFARGPNAVLFGDAQLGGVATTFTKIPRFGQTFYRGSARYTYPSTGSGRLRGTFDVNQAVGDRLALRVNALGEDGESWRDFSGREHKAVTASALFKLTDNTQIRIEGELGDKSYTLFSSNFADSSSYWNGTYTYDGTNPISGSGPLGAAGVSRVTAARLVWIPAVPEAGLSDWINTYSTNGTGLGLLDKPHSSVPNFPVLPSSEFTIAPIDSSSRQRYESLSLFLDHRFSESLKAQIAAYHYYLDNFILNSGVGGYSIDVNKYLPNGQANPKFLVPYADARPTTINPLNEVRELRALLTYRFELPDFLSLKQNFTLIAGMRREHFQTANKSLQQVAGPGQNANFNAAAMQIRYRYYWDEPLKFGIADHLPVDPTRTFAFVASNLVNEHKPLNYAQLSSFTTLFEERLAISLGLRHDKIKVRRQSAVTNANVNNGIPQLGSADGVVGGWTVVESEATSPSIGTVAFVTPWLGVFANTSRNFSMPSSGAPDVDGNSLRGPRGKGSDYGVKLSLLDGQVYATLSHYKTHQVGRITALAANMTQLRQNWTNIGSDDPARTAVDFRDTEELRASGYEFEIVANPSRNIRLSAGIAFPDTEIIDRFPGLRRYVSESLPIWQAALAAGTVNNATQLQNNINALRQVIDSSAEGARLDRTPDYRWNFYTSYAFSTGKLKGLSIGGGANGSSKIKIGTVDPRILFNTNNPTNEQRLEAAFAEVKAPARYTVSARIGYRFRLGKARMNVQLNVNNLLDDVDPQWRTTRVYTPPGGSLIQIYDRYSSPDPRTYILTTSFDF